MAERQDGFPFPIVNYQSIKDFPEMRYDSGQIQRLLSYEDIIKKTSSAFLKHQCLAYGKTGGGEVFLNRLSAYPVFVDKSRGNQYR